MKRGSGAGAVAALTLVCIFGVAMLMSLLVGAGVLRRVEDRVEENAAQRVGMSYITAKLHGYDSRDMIRVGPYGDGDAVFLTEEIGGTLYDTILYVHDGWLRELMCIQGWELEPEAGQTITEASDMTVTEPAPGLLRIAYTDGRGSLQSADVY